MITIAVCTWNRARYIEKTLDSFTRLQIPTGLAWEVVVVNNNSPDGTTRVLDSFLSRLPLRHFLETKQGIAHARNRAAAEARGDVVLWTDDDVQVKPNWLAGYARAFAKHPECGFFGGPVELDFEGAPPEWLLAGLDAIGGALGQVRVAKDAPIGETPQLPFNCNMAVLRKHHLEVPYDTRYGRKAHGLVSGEETVFMRELLSRGVKGRWLTDVPVLHAVPVERQTIAHLRKALTGVGHELGIRSPVRSKLEFLGIPLWLWRDALTFEMRFRMRSVRRASRGWQSDLAVAAISWGRIQRMLQDRGQAVSSSTA
ncbi:MAG TPA: glycosyltransferase [Gemmatimonadaceae bacterium]|nr:glycosyltransferase [Gemmatimonadaceae bacterium]